MLPSLVPLPSSLPIKQSILFGQILESEWDQELFTIQSDILQTKKKKMSLKYLYGSQFFIVLMVIG